MWFKESIAIKAPIEDVFKAWCQVERYPEWAPHMIERTKLTEGPLAVGTRFHCVDQWPGRRYTFAMEITELNPNRSLGAVWSKPVQGQWMTRFWKQLSSTYVEFKIELDLPLGMRLIAPLVQRYFMRENRRLLERFKEAVEKTVEDLPQA